MRKFCILLAGLLLTSCFGLSGCDKAIEKSLNFKYYIYSYPLWTGETSYHLTSSTPEEMAEEYDDRTLVREYECKGNSYPDFSPECVGSVFLVWDTYWFLYDVETDEETPVSLNEDREKTRTYVLIGDTEPRAVAIFHRENKLWGFFSIGADRMISDYEYLDMYHEEMIDGKIAVLTEDGAYLLDPLTGELCGDADPALFKE